MNQTQRLLDENDQLRRMNKRLQSQLDFSRKIIGDSEKKIIRYKRYGKIAFNVGIIIAFVLIALQIV